MKTVALITYSLLLVPSLFAASAKNSAESTAEGYPAWTGIMPENYIKGRMLVSGADLRQRVATVVVEFDAAKTAEQLEKTGKLAALNGLNGVIGHGNTSWETVQLPRDVMVIYVAHNVKSHAAVKEGTKFEDHMKNPGLYALARGGGRADLRRRDVRWRAGERRQIPVRLRDGA